MAIFNSMDLSHNDRCEELAHPNIGNFVLSWFILLGILLSYLPQHYRIIHRRTSEGISPYFVLLGTISGTSAIANILTLPTSRQDIACCKVNSGFSCAAGLLGIAQVGAQWSCFFIITFLFLIFVPRRGLQRHGHEHPAEVGLVPTNDYWQQALIVVAVSILHFMIVLIVSVIMLGAFPHQLQIWANILGIMGSVLASIQYLPQIHTTWINMDIGSFSVPMMLIQTPGSFVFAASLAIRLGPRGWSAWTVYLVTGCLQGVLLAMAITFSVRERQSRNRGVSMGSSEDEDLPDDDETENDPLLQSRKFQQQARKRLSGGYSPLAPHRLDPDPSSSEDERRNDRKLCGTWSSHTYHNVANNLARHFGLGSRPGSSQHVWQEQNGQERSRVPTQYYDSQSRRDSQATIVQEPVGILSASPFTNASRPGSALGSRVPNFRYVPAGRRTTESGSPNEDTPMPEALRQTRAASTIPTTHHPPTKEKARTLALDGVADDEEVSLLALDGIPDYDDDCDDDGRAFCELLARLRVMHY